MRTTEKLESRDALIGNLEKVMKGLNERISSQEEEGDQNRKVTQASCVIRKLFHTSSLIILLGYFDIYEHNESAFEETVTFRPLGDRYVHSFISQ